MSELMIQEIYVNSSEHRRFGESGWYEPYTDDLGELFRNFQREYGGCLSRMFMDVPLPGSTPAAPGTTTPDSYMVMWCGWVFSRREHYEDAQPIPGTNGRKFRDTDYYTREVWVQFRPAQPAEGLI
jgi:hypothetical protein